jgi:hypothetical protein
MVMHKLSFFLLKYSSTVKNFFISKVDSFVMRFTVQRQQASFFPLFSFNAMVRHCPVCHLKGTSPDL